MSKCLRACLLSLLIISAIASVVYFISKRRECCDLEDIEFFDDDFELDEDLKPASSREYVPLGSVGKSTKQDESEKITGFINNTEEKAEGSVMKAGDKAADFLAKASVKASDLADKAGDTISVFADKANEKISDLMTKKPE